jgi:tyrosinase
VHVRGINRARIPGSFLISAFATVDGKREHIGTDAVLSRWHVEGCMNCQRHLEATASFRLPAVDESTAAAAMVETAGSVEVEVRTHQGLFGGRPQGPAAAGLAAEAVGEAPLFSVEIR